MALAVVKQDETLWIARSCNEIDTSSEKEKKRELLRVARGCDFPGSRPCWRCGRSPSDPDATLIEYAGASRQDYFTMGTSTKVTYRSFPLYVCVPRCAQCAEREARAVRAPTFCLRAVGLWTLLAIVGGVVLAARKTGPLERLPPVAIAGVILGVVLLGCLPLGIVGSLMGKRNLKLLKAAGMTNLGTHPEVARAKNYSAEKIR